jgi:O-antigen/teichoic acid export membrane protein
MSLEPIRRQSLISFANIIGLTVLGYIATMYFAHILGPAVLGSYYLILSYYSIYSLVGDGGFGGAATKRISEGKEQNAFFSAFIVLRIILLAISVTILIAISSFLVDFTSSGLLPWLILALIIGSIAGFAATGVYSSGKVGVAQTSDFLNNTVRIAVQIIATYLGYEAAGLTGGFVVGLLAGILINFHYLPLRLARFRFSHLKSLFSFSFWIFLTSSGFAVFATADTILIGYFLSNSDVGIYRIGYQLATVALFTCTALNTVLFPAMSRWATDGNLASVSSALSRAFTFSLVLAIPVIVGGIVLSDRLLYFLYGADFVAATLSFGILLFVQLSLCFVMLQTTCLNALNYPKQTFMATAVAAVLNIFLNITLIPAFGIAGAGIATLVSLSLNAFLAFHFLSHHIPVRIERRSIVHILLSSLIMGAVVLLARLIFGIPSILFLIVAILAGAFIYVLVLLQLDARLKQEARELMVSIRSV